MEMRAVRPHGAEAEAPAGAEAEGVGEARPQRQRQRLVLRKTKRAWAGAVEGAEAEEEVKCSGQL